MRLEKQVIEDSIFALLKEWCDELIRLQIDRPGMKAFDGGILCPACMLIHGRCPDAIYPMMYMADRTGDEKYLNAAKKLFDWGENLFCDDGGMYNDAQGAWNGITVFAAVSLCDALRLHGHLLDAETRGRWEAHLLRMGDWLRQHLVLTMRNNINYFATNSCAMAVLGKYFDREDFRAAAKSYADYCVSCLSENGFLSGEGYPNFVKTPRGCLPIDGGGYNVEESLPSLCRYAWESGDTAVLEQIKASWRAHLELMLPDGAWDNSFGTRNFKWTYWGSRTSDGCQDVLFRLGKDDPVFAEAAWRNFELYRHQTHDGLLFGGPDYHAHGERACVHHSFCHAKALTGVLEEGVDGFERTALPSDTAHGLRHYPETDTWRAAVGDWRADVTAFDFNYMTGGHASGGTMSLLWHKKVGAVIAVGAVDYSLHEAHNQQLSVKKTTHRSVCPRIELTQDGVRWGNQYDTGANMTACEDNGVLKFHVDTFLCNNAARRFDGCGECSLDYAISEGYVTISGKMPEGAMYYLPIRQKSAGVTVENGKLSGDPETIFNLNPGFICLEYRILPDADGRFSVTLRV